MPTASILWSADHETGTEAQWTLQQGGESEYNAGNASSIVTTERARSSSRSLKQVIDTRSGESGTKMFRWRTADGQSLPRDGYYSTWLYYPTHVTVSGWWMQMGWKTKLDNNVVDNTSFIYIRNRVENGQARMYYLLEDKITNIVRGSAPAGVNVPVGRWVHLEAFYSARADNTGRVTVWQDGVQIIDARGYATQRSSNNPIARQFELANYGAGLAPAPTTRYVDDIVISSARYGTG